MPLTNKYLRYSPEITLEIFTLVWDKLIKTGLKGSHSESVAKKYSNFKSLYSYLELSSDLSCFECYEECSEKLETTVQEILGYNPFVKDDFVLPEKWAIKYSKGVGTWFDRLYYPEGDSIYESTDFKYLHYPKKDSAMWDSIQKGYTEITFEQFQKYILKSIKTQEEWDFVRSKFNPLGLTSNQFDKYKSNSIIIFSEDQNKSYYGSYSNKNETSFKEILSFQEWYNLNGYKMEKEVKFEVGGWCIWNAGNKVDIFKIYNIHNSGNRIHGDNGNHYDADKIHHATPEEINNHLISIEQIPAGELLDTGIEPNKDDIFKYTTYFGTTHVGKTSTISGPLKMILSIDDEELPMVNIIKTNSIKQLLNND